MEPSIYTPGTTVKLAKKVGPEHFVVLETKLKHDGIWYTLDDGETYRHDDLILVAEPTDQTLLWHANELRKQQIEQDNEARWPMFTRIGQLHERLP